MAPRVVVLIIPETGEITDYTMIDDVNFLWDDVDMPTSRAN